MKLTKFNIVTAILIVLVLLTICGSLFSISALSNYTWIAIFPLFAYLYYGEAKNKNHFFGFFLVGFSIVEILKIVLLKYDFDPKIVYYSSNGLAIVSYVSLIIFLIKDINLKELIKEFKLHIVVLIVFNGYIIYVLNQMIMQDSALVVSSFQFIVEVTYNVLILLMLSLSLLHFLYHQTKKELLVFLASVCIVFSEMVQVAYLFISSELLLEVAYTLLIGVGFYFLYEYIKINSLASKNQAQIA